MEVDVVKVEKVKVGKEMDVKMEDQVGVDDREAGEDD